VVLPFWGGESREEQEEREGYSGVELWIEN
jgi:hypothetical protein